MSKYESEHGTIKLPAGAMKDVRKAVVDAHNAECQRLFDKAVAILPRLLAEGKRKRDFDYSYALRSLLRDGDDACSVEALLFPREVVRVEKDGTKIMGNRVKKPRAPKKKDIGLLGVRAESVSFDDATISFSKDGRHVNWNVSENNHACERARAHSIARAFFRALERVTWTRGSGGKIVGNDEYNRDNDDEGGGGNYLVEEYGPSVKKARPASRSYGYNYFVPMHGRRF